MPHAPSAPEPVELGRAFNWPAAAVAAGLAAVLLAALVAAIALAGRPSPPAAPEVAAVPPPRPVSHYRPPPTAAPAAEAPARPVSPAAEPSPPPTPEPPTDSPAVADRHADRPPVEAVFPANPPPADPPGKKEFKRLDQRDEAGLAYDLQGLALVVDLDDVPGDRAKLLKQARDSAAEAADRPAKEKAPALKHPALGLIVGRDDLRGLPARKASECQAGEEAVKRIKVVSDAARAEVRRGEDPADVDIQSEWLEEGYVGVLVQVKEAGPGYERQLLVKALATIQGARAGEELAHLAVFDLKQDVREAAVQALKDRPRGEVRKALLDALRYPWPAAADHAAEALVLLEDREAVGPLVELLGRPDPSAPYRIGDGKWAVRELVCVNHLRNCLLCHAAATAKDDPLRGAVPTPGEPLPRLYYDNQKGNFVRADITYLKQDFSAVLAAPAERGWPERQRFDFLLRTRELSPEVAAIAEIAADAPPRPYPQREAVLFALRELTGADPGDSTAAWRRWLLKPGNERR
jgi:hypothetical protein